MLEEAIIQMSMKMDKLWAPPGMLQAQERQRLVFRCIRVHIFINV